MKRFSVKILALILSGSLINGCASTKQTTLYQQLGEKPGIAKLVEDFINEIIIEPRIKHHFEETDLDNTHDKLAEQICELANGPCQYTGKSMLKIHSDFDIPKGQFNAVVESLMKVMDDNDISVSAQNQLLALLVPMRKDIVSKQYQ